MSFVHMYGICCQCGWEYADYDEGGASGSCSLYCRRCGYERDAGDDDPDHLEPITHRPGQGVFVHALNGERRCEVRYLHRLEDVMVACGEYDNQWSHIDHGRSYITHVIPGTDQILILRGCFVDPPDQVESSHRFDAPDTVAYSHPKAA